MKTTLKLEEFALFLFGIFLFAQSPFDKLRVRWRGLKKFTLRQAQGPVERIEEIHPSTSSGFGSGH